EAVKERIGVQLKQPGHGTDAEPFRQRAHGPHQQIRRDTFAMEQRAVGLQKVPVTGGAVQLAPGATAGMPVGTEIAPAHPAPIGTGRMGAEVRRRVHLARAAARGYDAGWRATGWLGAVRGGLFTGGTQGLAGEPRKRLQVVGALVRWRQRLGWPLISSGTRVWPGIMQHDAEPEESQEHQLVEKEV